jgi:hypothetical protein
MFTQTDDAGSFDTMVTALQAHFAKVLEGKGSHLFQVDTADDLYQLYLDNLPLGQRQYHTCSCCRNFIRRFGSLATVNEDGTLTPAVWNTEGVPELYRESVAAMARAVARGKVKGVALSADTIWGTVEAGGWTHFAIRPPAKAIFQRTGALTARQTMAAKRESHKDLLRGLADYNRDVVAQAVTLLEADSLFDSEAVVGPARFLLAVHDTRAKTSGKLRDNLTWRAVAGAPSGFCQPRGHMVGQLIDDIKAGMSFETIKRRFDEKMHPLKRLRPQSPPSAGNIRQAEKLVAELGLEPSLRRRYARWDEIKKIWTPKDEEVKRAATGSGVFAYLEPKGSKPAQPSKPVAMPAQAITWEKFARTVLPKARKIEVYMEGSMNLCALATAVDPNAPPILQWDSVEERNPFSWYVYNGGSRPESWGLVSGTWVNVTAVTLQPSMWAGEDRFTHEGKSAILVLEGAKDERTAEICLFPSFLKSSLHEVRATIEAHSRRQTMEGGDQASANGLRVGKDDEICHSPIRVTTATGVAVYKIDRWD